MAQHARRRTVSQYPRDAARDQPGPGGEVLPAQRAGTLPYRPRRRGATTLREPRKRYWRERSAAASRPVHPTSRPSDPVSGYGAATDPWSRWSRPGMSCVDSSPATTTPLQREAVWSPWSSQQIRAGSPWKTTRRLARAVPTSPGARHPRPLPGPPEPAQCCPPGHRKALPSETARYPRGTTPRARRHETGILEPSRAATSRGLSTQRVAEADTSTPGVPEPAHGPCRARVFTAGYRRAVPWPDPPGWPSRLRAGG